MSKLVKLKLASKKSLACFLPNRMASAGTSTLFPSTEPEAPDDGLKPDGTTKAVDHGSGPKISETKADAEAASRANLGREIVTYGVETKKEKAEVEEEPEEILELKTPGFVRVFGCDSCADSDTDIRQDAHKSSSEASEDESLHGSHVPSHLIPVVHLRVPMRNEDDIRKVVAALHIKGVLEVACDLESQIVKVSGNADPDRLLKRVKKVKRKSKLISYSNPSAMPQSNLHSEIPFPTPPPPAYVFTQPAYEERFRPTSQPHVFSGERESHGPFSVPPHVRPAAQPRHYDNEAFYHQQHPPPPNVRSPPSNVRTPPPNVRHPPPNVRPPFDARSPPHVRSPPFVMHPPPATFYRDDSFHPEYIPRPPSSPPHFSSSSTFYPERSRPSLRRSTSPPRLRSYHHHAPAPHFRPPPPMPYPAGPPSHHRSATRGPGVPHCMDDYQQVPERMMHMYH